MRLIFVFSQVLFFSSSFGQDNLDRGLYAYNRGEYTDAIFYWNKYLSEVRGNDLTWTNNTYFNISQAYHFLDSSQLSYSYLDSILVTDSTYDCVYVFQARALIHLKKYDEAITRLDISISKCMNIETAFDTKISCFLYMEQWDQCIKLIEIYEKNYGYSKFSINSMKARCYYELGDFEKSATAAQDAYMIKSKNSYNLITLILLYGKVNINIDFCVIVKSLEEFVSSYKKSNPDFKLDIEVVDQINKIKTEIKC